MDIREAMKELVDRGGSDLHLKVGRPPLIRKGGELTPFQGYDEISEQEMREELRDLVGEDEFKEIESSYELDTSYHIDGVARFRINIFHQLGKIGVVMRAIPVDVPTIDEMGLPEKLKDFVMRPQGMVLATGPTGSGKSTTLACMVQHLNLNRNRHVITIEDPVEYVYTDHRCTINQREVGQDTPSFTEALRRGLRQDPDVILVGEMRDKETIEIALHAAETGHLVFSTLHTNDAKQTLDRILDTFSAEAQMQIRNMLSLSLEGVISQRLLRMKDKEGRVPAMELMDASPHIRDLIYDGKVDDIDDAIQESQDYYGMQTFNQSLAKLVKSGKVSKEAALATAQDPGDLRLMLKGIQKGSNVVDSTDFGDVSTDEEEDVEEEEEHTETEAAESLDAEEEEDEKKESEFDQGYSFDV